MIRFVLTLASIAGTLGADIIPASRMANFTNNVGIPDTIQPFMTNRTVFTNIPASLNMDTATFQAHRAACPTNGIIVLGAGTFGPWGDLDYQSGNDWTTIRGAGPGSTIVLMNGRIYVRKQFALPETATNLSSDVVKGSYTVAIATGVPSFIKTNHYYWISQLDDSAYCLTGGLEGGQGPLSYDSNGNATLPARGMCQINKLLSISGTTLTFERPMLWDYSTAKTAQLRKGFYDDAGTSNYRRGIVWSDMTIQGNQLQTDTDMFRGEYASYCVISNVVLTNFIGGLGVYLDGCYGWEIQHCDMRKSRSYAAGDGYCVGLYNGTTGSKIENNIFEDMHIGVDFSFSAAYNVIAYNFIGKGGPSSGTSPGTASHGHHNWMNLEEGNYSKEPLTGDITHGSGSHFIFLRNRVNTTASDTFTTDKTPFVAQYYNRYYSYVGNVVGSVSYQNGYTQSTAGADYPCGTSLKLWEIGCGLSPYDTMSQSQVLLAVNWGYVSGNTTLTLKDEGYSTNDIPNSYYLSGKPAWFGNRPWPYNPVDVTTAITNLPAGYRYTFNADPPSAAGTTVGTVVGSGISARNGVSFR